MKLTHVLPVQRQIVPSLPFPMKRRPDASSAKALTFPTQPPKERCCEAPHPGAMAGVLSA